MPDVAPCQFSKREIIAAGKALASNVPYDDRAIEIFRIANSWRISNTYPLKRVRAELIAKIRTEDSVSGITAARQKRMHSIRKKLRRTPLTLYQMQDLAGCRAIFNDTEGLSRVIERYLDGRSRYEITHENDYISYPQETGYRSRHLTVKYSDPDGLVGFDRHFVEIQFRTRAQHSWATCVEAVGLVTGEDLKAGEGNADWLRLFKIMAAEIAFDEECTPVAGVSTSRKERRKELIHLNGKLNALRTLDTYQQALKGTERHYGVSAPYYLIEFDLSKLTVRVRPFRTSQTGNERYQASEREDTKTSVLVEVEKVADLREAYPNYFLDVTQFVRRLRRALSDESMPRIDETWLHNWVSGRKT